MGAGDSLGVKSEHERRPDADLFVTGLSDVALVVAISRRNRDALAEMYSRHGAKVYGLARQVCGGDRAKEVVKQVFLEMWEKPHRYHPDRGSLRTFLLTEAHGRSVDRLRSDRPRQAHETSCVLARSAGDKVGGLLRALPDGQRDAIVLTYFRGYTYRDAANVLGEPEGTIKSWIRAGLARLGFALCEEDRYSPGSLA